MADTLSLDIKSSLEWVFQEAGDLTTVSDISKLQYKGSLTDGVASDQADKLWHDQRTLASAANDDLDLTNLTRTVFGSTITTQFAKVKALLIINTATTAGEELVVGAAAANAWLGPFGSITDTIAVPADSTLLLVNKKDGWTVTDVTADILRINNNGTGNITYKIAMIGTSS